MKKVAIFISAAASLALAAVLTDTQPPHIHYHAGMAAIDTLEPTMPRSASTFQYTDSAPSILNTADLVAQN